MGCSNVKSSHFLHQIRGTPVSAENHDILAGIRRKTEMPIEIVKTMALPVMTIGDANGR